MIEFNRVLLFNYVYKNGIFPRIKYCKHKIDLGPIYLQGYLPSITPEEILTY